MEIDKPARIVWANQAKADLLAIMEYIKIQESVSRARYVRDGIINTVNRIATFPNKHRIEPVFNRRDVRFSVKWRYKIVFQIVGETIRIISIFHTAKHPGKLAETDF